MPPENDPFASLPVARKKKPLPKTGDSDLREAGDSDEPSDPFAKLAVDAKSQVKGGLEQIKGAFAHPLDAAKAIVKGIATSARDTFKPVVGSGQMPGSTRFGDEDAIARSRANFRVTKENTPNAITPKEQALAAANTAINLALPAAGVLSLPARAAVNAGIGAINDSDQPLRGATAGLVLGEVLHATPKVAKTIGSPFDVSKGAIEAGVKDMAREVAADQAHGKTGMSPTRRTGDQIAMKYRKAVEPKPDAAGVSFGDTPLEQLTNEQLAVRARLAEDLGVRKDAIGEIRRRVKAQPDPADAIPIEDTAPPIEPPEDATAVSFPVDEGGVKPVASANGSFDVRPGVLRRINEGKDALPTPKSIPIVKREAGPSIEEPPAPRGRKAPDMFDSARTPNGSLRPFHRVSDDGLIRELTEYQAKIVDAQQRAQYNWTTDENFHSTEDGRAVVSATRIGGKGVSQQAKALQNLKDYSRIMDEIEAELDKRGHNKDTIYERQQHLSDLDAAVERDAIEHANALEESDTAFDFNDEPSAPADPFAELKTKLEEAEDRRATAEREAQHDELTGLPNKRAYQKALPSAEADPDAAVVRFDLNGFKSVNDTHGHAAGDAVLQSVPDVMAQAAADVGIPDRAFRPSGDEFAALVPKAQADAFRDRVEQLYGVKDHGKGVKTSISGGVGETDAIADQAAYQRKAIHKAEQGISSSRDPSPATAKREYLNYDKFALDQTTEARVREAVDRGRAAGTIDKGKKTFAQQRAEADRFAKEIVANPLDIDPSKLRNLSGAQIVGLHSVVGENTRIIEATSRAINSGELSPAELAEASALVDRATKSTDEALGAIVREKASTARDLGFLRQVARQSTDPDVWLVQAKKMLGDRPMPDSVMIEIRKLANEATLACGAG